MGQTWKPVLVGLFVGAAPIVLLLVLSSHTWEAVASTEKAAGMALTSAASAQWRLAQQTVLSAPQATGGASTTPTVSGSGRWSRDSALEPRLVLAGPEGSAQPVDEIEIVSPSQEQTDQELARMEIAAEEPAPGAGPGGSLGSAVPSSVRQWEVLIVSSAERYGLDPNLIAALMMTESGGSPDAVSSRGAIGLMQVIDGSFDPEANVDDGARILADHISRFQTLELALAAYNAGAGAVQRYGGVPPYRETRDLVFRVMLRLDLYGGSTG